MKNKKAFLMLIIMSLIVFTGCLSSSKKEETKKENTTNEGLTFYIVRHGKTMLNTTDRVQGWSDAFLTKSGEEEVTKAGQRMSKIDFQSAYSSDSGRAMQTAKLLLNENQNSANVEINPESRLREFNFGTYEGDLNKNMWGDLAKAQNVSIEEFLEMMTMESFANSVAKVDRERNQEGSNWPAEDYQTIIKRLEASINDIAKKESAESGSGNILLVSHGLSISALLDKLFPEFEMPDGGIKNAAVCVVTYKDNKFSLKSVNDTSYNKE